MAKTSIVEKKEKFNEGAFLKGLVERLESEGRIISKTEPLEAYIQETFLAVGWKLGKEAENIKEGGSHTIMFTYDDSNVISITSTKKDNAFQIGIEIAQEGKELKVNPEHTTEFFNDTLRKRVFKKVLANHGYGIKNESFLEILIEIAIAELINFTRTTRKDGETFVLVIDDIVSIIATDKVSAIAEKELKKLIKNDAAILD